MKMNSSTEGREFAKKHDLIYIYHNRIDKTGDDKASEEKVFEAAMRWLTHQPKRKELTHKILSNVRFPLMSPLFLNENVIETLEKSPGPNQYPNCQRPSRTQIEVFTYFIFFHM